MRQIRQALYQRVSQADNITIMTDAMVKDVNYCESHSKVIFADKSTIETKLVIAADSRFSGIRRKVGILLVIFRDNGRYYNDQASVNCNLCTRSTFYFLNFLDQYFAFLFDFLTPLPTRYICATSRCAIRCPALAAARVKL